MTSKELAHQITRLINKATSKGGEVPFNTVMNLGSLVTRYHALVVAALESRNDYMDDNPY